MAQYPETALEAAPEDPPTPKQQLHVTPTEAKPPARKKRKNKPGQGPYSQLVLDSIRKLGERNGSSLAKIYSEAKKVSWFDQQNGRTYLKYSIKALVRNKTLTQTRGAGANGKFRLNLQPLNGKRRQRKPRAAKKGARVTWGHKAKPRKAGHGRVTAKSHKKAGRSRSARKGRRSVKRRAPASRSRP